MCVMNIALPCLDKWIATRDTQKSNKSVNLCKNMYKTLKVSFQYKLQ